MSRFTEYNHFAQPHLRDGATSKKRILLNRYSIDVPVDKNLATALNCNKCGASLARAAAKAGGAKYAKKTLKTKAAPYQSEDQYGAVLHQSREVTDAELGRSALRSFSVGGLVGARIRSGP